MDAQHDGILIRRREHKRSRLVVAVVAQVHVQMRGHGCLLSTFAVSALPTCNVGTLLYCPLLLARATEG